MGAMRLTKSEIAKLPLPAAGQAFYRDDKLRGLAVRVTARGTKSFVLEKLIHRKVRRITLGRCDALQVEVARKQAQRLLGQIAEGRDPASERKRTAASSITLDDVFAEYLEQRGLRPKSIADYRRVVEVALVDWRQKPLSSITRDGVSRRFTRLRDKHGPAWANLSMRVLRALFNFAAGKYADEAGKSPFAANPVRVLSQTKAWAKIDRRRSVIKPHELVDWYRAVRDLGNTIARDYLLLLIFTGLRRGEAARLRWCDIDLRGRTLTVPDTKNRRPHTLPLSQFLHAMLEERSRSATGDFVFPGAGRGGHVVSLKDSQRNVIEASGVSFTLHDLRRTFTTVAESLDIPGYALKRMLNHSDGADVTAGYIVASVERLREPMEKVAEYLARAMGIKPTKLYSFKGRRLAAPKSIHAS
jgi:integrase